MNSEVQINFIPNRDWSRDEGHRECLSYLTYAELLQRKKTIINNRHNVTNNNTKRQEYSNMANGKRFFRRLVDCPFKIDL